MPVRKAVSASFFRVSALLTVVLSTIIPASVARAQSYLNATGTPTFTTALPVEMGFVNVANGNLHLEIPLASFPQRGTLRYNARLVYDSSIWKNSGGTWQPTNVANSMGGWRLLTGGEAGSVTSNNVNEACDTPPPIQFRTAHTAFVWTAPDGTSHRFPIFTMRDTTICQEDVSSDSTYADDSSGYFMSVTNYTSATVYAPDGTQVFPTVMDTNGNFFSKDANGNIIDTLGRTPITVTTNGNTITYGILNTQGGRTNVTVTTTTVSANTSFGESGVTECTTCSVTAIQSIAFDDNSSYSFTYDSGTTAGHFGELTGMTLRSGGTVSYAYTTFTDGLGNVNRWLSSKTGGGNTWTITPQAQGQTAQLVIVGAPSGDHVNYSFSLNNGAWVSEATYVDAVQGVLLYVTNTWDMSNSCPQNSNCTGAAFVRKLTTLTQLPSGLQKTVTYSYQSAATGQVSEIDESDYGTTTLPILRKALFSYAPLVNAVSKPSQILVEDGSGSQVAKTNFAYDEIQPVATSGVPQHNTAAGSRGNLTTLTQWVSSTAGSLITKFSYDDTGNVLTRTDPFNNVTAFSYTDNFSDGINRGTVAYLTQITMPSTGSPAVLHILKMQYDVDTGFVTKSTDLNNHDTTASYDPVLRKLTTNFPDGGQTVDTYNSPTSITQSRLITSSQTMTSAIIFDSLGRVSQQQITSDPLGTDFMDTTYNPNGQVASVSNAHRSTSSPTDGITQFTYDVLGRATVQTQPDLNTAQASYSNNCVTTTDEAGHQRETCSDGLGRITKVLEPDNSGALTLETDITYDVLNKPLAITQKGGSANSADWRVRSFTYDGLGRLTQMTAPESGTTIYNYTTAAGALCAGDPSLPCRITDARNITKTMTYDALNRLIGKTYSDSTPPVTYSYDQSSFNGLTITNGNGLRTGMSDASGQTAWSFDSMGRVVTRQQTIGTVTKSMGYTYNLDGSTATMTYPSGRVYTYGYNNAAQPTSVVDVTNNINYFTSGAYAPPGLLTGANHGAKPGWTGITLADTFNNRLQPTELRATSPVPLTLLDLGYSYDQGGGKDNGSVAQIANLRDSTRTVNYTYDQLNRLSSAATTAATWGDSYVYDAWGNLLQKNVTKGTAESLALTVNSSNQINGLTYDAAGNLLSDGSNSMTYDAENRRNPTSGTTFTYDGDGRRVAKSDGTVYWVDDNLRPLSLGTTSGSITKDFVFLGSKRIAFVALSTGNPYYYLSDHLGSTAVIGSGDGKAIEWEADYFPFGNERQVFTNLVSNPYQFTGYEYDSNTGYNYAVARFEAGRWGRFLSPDPYVGSMDVANPQTLNRYSYVRNNPIENTDPSGLCDVVGAGITEGPGEPETQQMDIFANSIGAMQVFPYAGMDLTASLGSIEAQSLGVDNSSVEAQELAINLAAQDSPGPINLFGFSGDAQAIASAVAQLPSDVRERIDHVVLLSPGVGVGAGESMPMQALVYQGNGIIENAVTYAFDNVDRSYNCGHDANCAFSAAASLIKQFAGTPCKQPRTVIKSFISDPIDFAWPIGGFMDDFLQWIDSTMSIEVVTTKFVPK